MKKILFALLVSVSLSLSVAQTLVTIQTNKGNIELTLDDQKAPKTVANFVSYANSGFYNGTIFHRVIDGFMVQGGGFDEKMNQKTTKPAIPNEADNGLKNDIGTIAMARTNAPHSATSQFFINVANNEFLNHRGKTTDAYGYTVFGRVTKGMDVVNKIAKVKTANKGMHGDVPVESVIINKVIVHKQKGK